MPFMHRPPRSALLRAFDLRPHRFRDAVRRQAAGSLARSLTLVVALMTGLALTAPCAAAQNLAPTYRPYPTARGRELQALAASTRAEARGLVEQLQRVELALGSNLSSATVAAKRAQDSLALAGQATVERSRATGDSILREAVLAAASQGQRELRVAHASLDSVLRIIPATAADSVARSQMQVLLARDVARLTMDSVLTTGRVDSLGATRQTSVARAARLMAFAQAAGADVHTLRGSAAPAGEALRRDSARLADAIAALRDSAAALDGQAVNYKRLATRTWLPVKNADEAREFYGRSGLDLARNVLFSGGLDGRAATVAAEAYSGYVWRTRVSLGVVVADAKDEAAGDTTSGQDRAAVERFLAGGGNLTGVAVTPLAFLKDSAQDNTLTIQLGLRTAFDFSGVDRSTALSNPKADAGVDLYGTVFGGAPYFARAACAGGSGAFTRAVAGSSRGWFCYAQVTAGAEVPRFGRIALSGVAGPGPLRRALTLTVQPIITGR
jgi:hypothetical protein